MTPETDGYAVFDRVFDSVGMAALVDHLEQATLVRTRAGARHLLSVPMVRTMAGDSKLLHLAAQFVGPGAAPFRATLFDKSPSSNWLVVWHQDTALPLRARSEDRSWGPWSTKSGVLYAHAPAWALESVVALRLHLDDSTATNGPLRVLPKTHNRGVLTETQVHELSKNTPPVDCLASSGGVVAMRPLVVHASSKSTDNRPRRVLHIEYASALDLGRGIQLAIA
jgi:hypothetical protein